MPVAAASPSLTDIDPVGCLVTGTLEAIPFHEGFQQINWMPVFLHPVTIDTPIGSFSLQSQPGKGTRFEIEVEV